MRDSAHRAPVTLVTSPGLGWGRDRLVGVGRVHQLASVRTVRGLVSRTLCWSTPAVCGGQRVARAPVEVEVAPATRAREQTEVRRALHRLTLGEGEQPTAHSVLNRRSHHVTSVGSRFLDHLSPTGLETLKRVSLGIADLAD